MLRFVAVIVLLTLSDSDATCSWDKCNAWSKDKNVITAHLIPHTHDDLGWLKTVDQYFWGTPQEPFGVGVQYIYNTVIDELLKDPTKRFSFAETGFLWRWYESYGDAEKHSLQKLIKNTGQIEMIGGGWVQNDEAAAHYVDIIDQMTVGLRHLMDTFGECGKPQVSWQIDPFGHSKEMANIYALMGYTSLFFARLHYQEKKDRLDNKTLEMIWNASDELKTAILTGAFYQDNYGPPEGFCWDRFCADEPIMDNPDLEEYNVVERITEFADYVKKQAKSLRTNQAMFLMGSDFQYTNANQWFTNMDRLIKYTNANESLGVKVIYSTPACYSQAVLESQPHLETKSDDFFPYASAEHSYWTGYFTSRPAFKGMIRQASALLQLQKQLDIQADLEPSDDSDVEIAMEASALVQHHDAVTGTAKDLVTKDYRKQLARGMAEAETVINDFRKVKLATNSSEEVPVSKICLLSNETRCDASSGATFSVSVFNARAQQMTENIRIPYYSAKANVVDSEGKRVAAQVIKTFQVPQLDKKKFPRAAYELVFPVDVGPLGYNTYVVDNSTTRRASYASHTEKRLGKLADGPTAISNEFLTLQFDNNGYLASITDIKSNVSHPFRQEFFYYEGVDNKETQPSGAYIFRPVNDTPIAFADKIQIEVVQGDLVQEVRQTVSPWVSQIIRLHKTANFVEFDWIVGPIPVENSTQPISKEVITRYSTNIYSKGTFYTDSNGRQMMERKYKHNQSFKYNDTEPVAANYYPVTNRIFIKDDSTQLTILPDRSEGGASLKSGDIEIMLHRRCFYDDHFGVDEPLNETEGSGTRGLVVRGTHVIHIGDVKTAASVHRPLAVKVFHKPVVAYSAVKDPKSFLKNFNLKYSGLTKPLPDFANIVSLQKWQKKSVLLRLEHIYQNYEDTVNSQPQEVDLTDLFTDFTINSMNELMLGANRNATSNPWTKRSFKSQQKITISPQQIRTFQLSVTRK